MRLMSNGVTRTDTPSLPWLAPQSTFPVAVRYHGGITNLYETLEPGDFRVRGRYLDRLGRPVAQPILDWVHDELAPSQ
jgi:hypothetical protein